MSSNNLQDQLDRNYAPAWRPAPGDSLIGEVTEISERAGYNGDLYVIVTIRRPDGEEAAAHAFHDVLSNELARIAPKVGDTIGIKYLGVHPERNYHRYRVRRAGGNSSFSWGDYRDGGGESEPDIPLEPPVEPASRSTAQRAEDDVPF